MQLNSAVYNDTTICMRRRQAMGVNEILLLFSIMPQTHIKCVLLSLGLTLPLFLFFLFGVSSSKSSSSLKPSPFSSASSTLCREQTHRTERVRHEQVRTGGVEFNMEVSMTFRLMLREVGTLMNNSSKETKDPVGQTLCLVVKRENNFQGQDEKSVHFFVNTIWLNYCSHNTILIKSRTHSDIIHYQAIKKWVLDHLLKLNHNLWSPEI